jgi:hypothetical protein
VVAELAGQDPGLLLVARAVVVEAGHLDGGVHALRAARGEEHPLQPLRREGGQSLGEPDRLVVGVDVEAGEVAELAGLTGGDLGDLLAAVTDLRGPVAAAGGVEQLGAVGVPDRALVAPHDDAPLGVVGVLVRVYEMPAVHVGQGGRTGSVHGLSSCAW